MYKNDFLTNTIFEIKNDFLRKVSVENMNETHPIEGLMKSAMNSIKDMVDVNTIIGEPIETTNQMVIIPISKVCFGFAAGGSEFHSETVNEYKKKDKEEEAKYRLPFGGGSGAGVSISPVAFIVVMQDSIKVLPIEHSSAIDKLIDYVPDLMQRINTVIDKNMDIKIKEKQEQTEEKKEEAKPEKVTNVEIDYDVNVEPGEYLEDE